MELSRWIAAALAPQAKAEALRHFGVDAASLLATGTEAELLNTASYWDRMQ